MFRQARGAKQKHWGALSEQFFSRLNDLTTAVVATVFAGPVHNFGIAAVVALHQLRSFQTIVVPGAAFARTRFRMTALRNSHDKQST